MQNESGWKRERKKNCSTRRENNAASAVPVSVEVKICDSIDIHKPRDAEEQNWPAELIVNYRQSLDNKFPCCSQHAYVASPMIAFSKGRGIRISLFPSLLARPRCHVIVLSTFPTPIFAQIRFRSPSAENHIVDRSWNCQKKKKRRTILLFN